MIATASQMRNIETRLGALESLFQELRNDIAQTGKGNAAKFDALHATVGEGHERLLEGVQERLSDLIERRGGRWGPRALFALGLLVLAAGGWAWWRKRREDDSKKFL
jgi:LPXTG-motif cell wall-anchored protein